MQVMSSVISMHVKIVFITVAALLSSCGGNNDEEQIPTVEELESMTSGEGSDLFEQFIEMEEEYEKTKTGK